MNRAPKESSVKLHRELTTLLQLTSNSQSVFWVAVLEGAATSEGWISNQAERAEAFSRLRGRTIGKAPFQISADELVAHNMMEIERDGSTYRCRLPDNSLMKQFFALFDLSLSSQQSIDQSREFQDNVQDEERSSSRQSTSKPHNENIEQRKENSSIEKREKEKRDFLSFGQAFLSLQLFPPSGAEENGKAVTYREATEKLVKFWGARSGRRGVRVVQRRINMVRGRLLEGYKLDDLYQAIAGVCYSPFHRNGGYDTFEVAIRNSEQVEKCKRLWLLHAPIQHVEKYIERTGEVVHCRADELRARARAKTMSKQQSKRLDKARQAQAEREKARHDEHERDNELTELALAGLEEDGGTCG